MLAALGVTVFACSDDPEAQGGPPLPCNGLGEFRFEHGSPDGHPDPFGAKAAGQARAGRIREASQIIQGPLARNRVRVGDFVLANDRIAVYIEAEGRREGYQPFGGDVTGIEPVGEDGKPQGSSAYGETLIAFSRQTIKPDKVSVLADGSDGKAAIVRVSGVLANIPFLDTFKAISQPEYDIPAALDYVLEPGSDKVLVRLHLANASEEPVDFSKYQRLGFFHSARNKVFTEANGYADPKGENPWVAFDGGGSAFAFRSPNGPVRAELEVSGFRLFSMGGLSAEACETKTVDYLEIIAGGPGIDGLLEAKRRALGEPAWREVRGTVKDESGTALGGAFVHATTPDGKYLTRALANENGEFVIHVPDGAVLLTPTMKGWALPSPTSVEGSTADLVMPKPAYIEVNATDEDAGELLPVRVQVIPKSPVAPAPPSFGLREEVDGRLWQEFAVTGKAKLPVPPGEHHVVVSRGYEYEIVETDVTANADTPAVVDAKLKRSVDTTGVMCADFHVHSWFSADSQDPVEEKLKGAIADGLDIPVSSEHEWVVDFHPIVQRLGLTKWAFGMPSSELTTFTWGHFGVVPLLPREDQPNNGAVDWVGKKPGEFFQLINDLPEKPVLIVNHPSGTGFGAYFDAAGFDRATASGDPELWSDAFSAVEVFNDSDFDENRNASVADWFALLNAGKTYWAVGNSDSHDQRRTFVGYPRTCLRFGHDDPTKLTNETVRDVLRTGAATISGGLYMTVEGPGGIGPGGTTSAGQYKVVVQATGWFSATSLEVIVDGVSVSTLPLTAVPSDGPGKRYEATVDVAPADSRPRHWVVFHAKGDGDLSPLHPRKKPFAVSNPIFFQ